MRKRLGEVAAQNQLDIAIQQEGLGRRAKRLVVLDVDSTLIQDEVIELLGAEAGCETRIKEITDRAMLGEIDFEQAFASASDYSSGLDADAIGRARATMRLTPGANVRPHAEAAWLQRWNRLRRFHRLHRLAGRRVGP
ncbi:MAG: hypothetical protein R2735_02130 [Microthrixaceae bacterium]